MSLIVRMCRSRTRMSDQRHRQTSMSLGVCLRDVRDLCIFDSTTRLSRDARRQDLWRFLEGRDASSVS
jgi:hypothetical protein